MKKLVQIIVIFIFLIGFHSCEDVVDVDLKTDTPKLVIDAAINWKKGTSGNLQQIKLSTTTNFYSTTVPVASNALINVTNLSTNQVFNFIEVPTTGVYICTDFVPNINNQYRLEVKVNNQNYTATETLFATPAITTVEQIAVQGFDKEEIQVKYFYPDNGLENNFYLLTVKQNNIAIPVFNVTTDEFFQGNTMFGFYTEEKLKATDILDLSVQNVSQQYYDYMNKFISISGGAGSSPFQTTPAILRGNIKNITNSKNFPLGFFSLGETDNRNYIVQ